MRVIRSNIGVAKSDNREKMSKKAVYTRIQNSAEWLRAMSEKCLKKMKLPKPKWLTKEVVLVDGSELSKEL